MLEMVFVGDGYYGAVKGRVSDLRLAAYHIYEKTSKLWRDNLLLFISSRDGVHPYKGILL